MNTNGVRITGRSIIQTGMSGITIVTDFGPSRKGHYWSLYWPTTWNGSPAFRLADGGTIVFGSNPVAVRATKIIDPYGQETNDNAGRRLGLITV